jgi:predicted metal-dependent hydrolase
MKRTLIATGLLTLLLAAPAAMPAERHPEIRAAQRALANAEHHLDKAARDFGGHRVKAMELIREAQKQLHEALEFAEHRGERR